MTQDADGKITGKASGKVQTDRCPHPRHQRGADRRQERGGALARQDRARPRPRQYRIDETGSKLADLKNAANALVDQLVAATGNPADLKIALVPFSQTVNVGAGYKTAAWLDTGALSPINDEIFTTATGTAHANRLTLFSQMGVAWGGCVEIAQGALRHHRSAGRRRHAGDALHALFRARRARSRRQRTRTAISAPSTTTT